MPRGAMKQRTLAPRWLNTLEAAAYLGLSPNALRERRFVRKVPYSKLNGSLRLDRAENPVDIVLRTREGLLSQRP